MTELDAIYVAYGALAALGFLALGYGAGYLIAWGLDSLYEWLKRD